MTAVRRLFVSSLVAVVSGCSLFVSLDDLQSDADGGGGGGADAGSDAPGDGGAKTDAAPDASVAMCDPSTPFENVHLFLAPEGYAPYRITLTDDENETWFAWNYSDAGHTAYPIEHGVRAGPDASFALNDEVALSGTDPAVVGNGLMLYYIYDGPIGGFDLAVATRSKRSELFSGGLLVPGVSTSSSEIAPFFSSDGALWFCSGRARDAGDYSSDVWRAAPKGSGFDTPAYVPELSDPVSGSSAGGIVLTKDLLTAYVTSNRQSPQSIGGNDVFRSTRASTADAFGPLSNEVEINSADRDRATWISPDNCRLYFESDRDVGYSRIFVAEKTPP